MSIVIYSHCMHCLVLARNKQWKHWNTIRNGKCWQLQTPDFGPHCHSLSQTIWQAWNLKLSTLRTLFLFLTLSFQQLLHWGDRTQRALGSTMPTSACPRAELGSLGPNGDPAQPTPAMGQLNPHRASVISSCLKTPLLVLLPPALSHLHSDSGLKESLLLVKPL